MVNPPSVEVAPRLAGMVRGKDQNGEALGELLVPIISRFFEFLGELTRGDALHVIDITVRRAKRRLQI